MDRSNVMLVSFIANHPNLGGGLTAYRTATLQALYRTRQHDAVFLLYKENHAIVAWLERA